MKKNINNDMIMWTMTVADHIWAEQILKHGEFDINYQDHNGNTLLHYFLKTNNKLMVETLIKYHPNVFVKNKQGVMPINLLPNFFKKKNY